MNWKKAVKNSVVTNMENMGIYFEEERKKTRWDSGAAVLHKESAENKKEESPQKDNEASRLTNSYGTLRYLKKDKKKGESREGFALEAFEAPGTPVHTDKEKHLNRQNMKKIGQANKKTLFSSEVPLRNQALFFNMTGSKKSTELLNNMKELLHRRGHQTLKDTFGFLDQESELMELESLKSEQRDSLSPESKQTDRQLLLEERQDTVEKRIDTLNSRLLRKKARERQLCNELQLMLDQRTREEVLGDQQNLSQKEQESPQKAKNKHNDSPQRHLHSNLEVPGTVAEGEADEAPEESDSQAEV